MNEATQSALLLAQQLIAKDHCYLDEKRWQEWLMYEADVINNLEIRGDRVH
jgi:hypothetical protein